MQPYYIHPGSLLNAISVEEKTALGRVIFLQNEFNKKVTWKTELKQNEEIFSTVGRSILSLTMMVVVVVVVVEVVIVIMMIMTMIMVVVVVVVVGDDDDDDDDDDGSFSVI